MGGEVQEAMREFPAIVGVSGAHRGYRFTVTEKGLRLGREPGNDILIPDHGVSRQHARFLIHNGTLWVQDVGSRNGIFVNGERVRTQRPLSVGDRIQVGQHVFEVQLEEAPVPTIEPEQGSAPSRRWKLWPFLAVGAVTLGLVVLVVWAGHRRSSEVVAPQETPSGGGSTISELLRSADVAQGAGEEAAELPSSPVEQGEPTARDQAASGGLPSLADLAPAEQAQTPLGLEVPDPPEGMTAGELVEKGRAEQVAGRLHDALVAYAQALKLDPNCSLCRIRIDQLNSQIAEEIEQYTVDAQRYYETLQYQKAINAWEMVLLLDPNPESPSHKQAEAALAEVRAKLPRQY